MFVYHKCYISIELTFTKELMLITSKSKELNICHYLYFLNKGFKFQPNVCNRYHDLLMMSPNFSDIAILNIKNANYRSIVSVINKIEAINLMQNADLMEIIETLQSIKNLLLYMKIGKEILTFEDIETEKNKFHRNKILLFLKDVDIEKVLVSNKISFDEKNYKYFIGYLYNDDKVKSLQIMLPKTSAYVRNYDGQTKWMYVLIEDDDVLQKYDTIWDKVSADIKKEFDSEPVYNKNFLKTKITLHGDEVTDFYDKKLPKLDLNHTCLAVISLNSALKKYENFYPQVFLKECQFIEKKLIRHIIDSLSEFSSSDESDEE